MDANRDLPLKDEVFALVGAAMEVHSILGSGFLEAVWGKILVEMKAVRSLGDVARAQAINYLRATRLPLAVLLNFGASKLDWMRLALTQ